MKPYQTVDEADVAGRRILVRVDINVPVQDGRITDDTRIRATVPTVREILAKGGRPILVAHRGRPKGRPDPELSLGPLCRPLSSALDAHCRLAEPGMAKSVEEQAVQLPPGQVLLLENIRFHEGEEANAPALARWLAMLADFYVNDAFSVSHRVHASVVGVAGLLPAFAGRQMQAELAALERALTAPQRPVVAVVGGAKVSTKLDLIGNLMRNVEEIVIGGAMANTFLAALGRPIGKSLYEPDLIDTARHLVARARLAGCEIVLPTDVVVANEFKANTAYETVLADCCPDDAMILDVGLGTVADIARRFARARTILWNGPLGAFEVSPFNVGTDAAATAAADVASAGRVAAIAGGGDTVAALNACGAADRFTYVSTAGGAFLEWLEGKTLPGIAALEKSRKEEVD